MTDAGAPGNNFLPIRMDEGGMTVEGGGTERF